MQLNGLRDIIVTVLLFVGVIGLVGFTIMFLLTSSVFEDTVSDTKIETQFTQYINSADSYNARMTDYIGLCDAIGLPDTVSCSATAEAYAMETSVATGGFYCIDSSGFVGNTTRSKGSQTTCPR